MALVPAILVAVLAAAPVSPRAGVIATGPDAAAAGGLQRRLEAKLAGNVVPAEELAKRLATPGLAPSTDMVLQREAERLLDATQKAFYEGSLDDALARIAELDKLTVDAPSLPMRNRALLLLWRAAVLLEKQAVTAAEAPAREALAYSLVPPLVVDEKTFPPPLVTLVTKLRKTTTTAKLTLAGLPAGTSFRIDDADIAVPAGGAFALNVPTGRHRLQAWATGYAAATLSTDVLADLSVSLSLPLALEPADALALMEAASGRADRARLDALAKRLDLDVLVVATQKSVGAPISTYEWKKSKIAAAPVVPPTPAGEDAIAMWSAQRLASQKARSGPRTVSPLSITPSVAAFGSVRTFDVKGSGGSYSALFGGPGMRAGAVATRGNVVGGAEVSYATYSLSPVTADLPDGGSAKGSGGTTMAGALAGGWRFRRDGLAPYVAGGVSFERHAADDLASSAGELSFFPSHERVSLDVTAGFAWPLSFGVVQGRATVQPVSTYSESPRMSGRDAAPGPGLVLDAGVERPYGPWLLSARFRGERITVGFRGQASAPVSPSLRNASVTETAHSLSIVAGRRF